MDKVNRSLDRIPGVKRISQERQLAHPKVLAYRTVLSFDLVSRIPPAAGGAPGDSEPPAPGGGHVGRPFGDKETQELRLITLRP